MYASLIYLMSLFPDFAASVCLDLSETISQLNSVNVETVAPITSGISDSTLFVEGFFNFELLTCIVSARRRPEFQKRKMSRLKFKVQFFTACLGLLESARTRPFVSPESRNMVRSAFPFSYFDIS
jgi:hypothetical protein